MTRRTRVSSFGLLLRHFIDGVGTSLLVALLIMATVFAVAVIPRALAVLGTQELRYRVSALSPLQRDFTATSLLGSRTAEPPKTADDLFGGVQEALAELPGKLEDPLAAAVGAPQWTTFTSKRAIELEPLQPGEPEAARLMPIISLSVDLQWTDRIRIVDGRLPEAWTGDESDDLEPAARPPIELVLSVETAALMELSVGDVVGWSTAPLALVGTYEPADPADPYWLHAPELALASENYTAEGHEVIAAGFVDPETAVGLYDTFRSSGLRAWYAVDAAALEFADTDTLVAQIASLETIGERLPTGELLTFRTGVEDVIKDVVGAVTAVSSLLALTISGPLGVVLAAYAIGVQAVIRRRSRTLALAAARGASDLQVRSAMALEGLILGVPAGAIGATVAAVLVPVEVGWSALLLPAALALLPAVLFAVFGSPRSFRAGRREFAAGGRRRWLAEIIVAGLAALSLFLLFRRGLAGTSAAVGIDPLLAATPLLLSLAVCLLVLRVLPLPLRALLRVTRGRRGAIGLLGAARALREPALGFTAALALVVGITVAVFSSVLATTVDDGLRTAAQEEVGADLQVRAPELGDAVVDQVRSVDGVASIAPLRSAGQAELGDARTGIDVTMIFTDTAAFREQRPSTPDGLTDDQGAIPVLVSSELAPDLRSDDSTLNGVPVRVTGEVAAGSLPGFQGRWVVIDTAFAPQLIDDDPRTVLLLVGAAPGTELPALADRIAEVVTAGQRADRVGDVVVTDRASLVAVAEQAPVVAGVRLALLTASIAALLLSALTVVLASISAAAARHRILGVLRVLGTTAGKLRGLLAWELAPVAVVTILAGTALGLVLPWIVTLAVDLRPFVGGANAPTPVVQPVVVAAVIAVFVIVVVLAGALAVAIGRRRDPNATLRMGAE